MSDQPVLIHGDCLEVMPTLQNHSINFCFADMPYGITANHWDRHLPLNLFWDRLNLLLSDNAAICFSASMRFAVKLIQAREQWFRHDIVWNKTRASSFANAKISPMRSHEHLLIFGKNKGTYNPQMTTGHAIKKSRTGLGVSTNFQIVPQTKPSSEKRYPLSICSFPRDDMRRRHGHPTQKPVALLEWLIKTYTKPGDTVLDPVAGSATTAIAAMRTGRKAICIEKDPTYFEAMTKRVAEEQRQMDLSKGSLA